MIISPDRFSQSMNGTASYLTPESGLVWELTQDRVRRELADHDVLVLMVGLPSSGKSTWLVNHAKPGRLYIDTTFCLPEYRAPFIEIAKQAGKPVISIWVDTPFEVCLVRNAEHPADRRIPEELFDGWWASLLESPPSEGEGLDASWRVTEHDNVRMVYHGVPEYGGSIPARKTLSAQPSDQDDLLLYP